MALKYHNNMTKDVEVLLLKYRNNSWSNGHSITNDPFAFGMLSAAFILLFLAVVGTIYTLSFNLVFVICGVSSILFLILAFLFWPYIPCFIKIFSNSIIFNLKSSTRLYNPKRQLLLSDIKLCEYLNIKEEEIIEMHFITKTGQKSIINLSGAKNDDIEKLIKILEKKRIKVARKT